MVILGRELKPGGGAAGSAAWLPGTDARLSGAAISAAASGLDLEAQVQWYHDVLGLQLISLADGSAALLAADLKPGSFRLELLAPPEDAEGLPAAAAPTPSPSASSGGAGGGGSPSGAAAAAAAFQPGPGPGLATGFGHFSLVVPSTAAVVDALKAAGQADLVLEECAAVIPVRSHGRSWTDRTSRIRDINGYTWQLMEVHSSQVRERMCSVMLHVADLHASLQWYTGVLGFRVHQSYESQETGYLSALLGFGPELQCTLLELRQQWQPAGPAAHDAPAAPAAPATAAEAAADAAAVLVDLPSPRARRPAAAAPGGQQLVRFVVEKPDLQAAADRLRARGQPFEVEVLSGSEDPGSGVPAVEVTDADGWTFCLVEAAGEGEGEGAGKGGGGGGGRERVAMEE